MKLSSDPTRDELIEFCNQYRSLIGDGCSDNEWSSTVESAIRYFAENYHSGQFTSLYSVLCSSPYTPGMIETFVSWSESDMAGCHLYEEMASEHAKNFHPEFY